MNSRWEERITVKKQILFYLFLGEIEESCMKKYVTCKCSFSFDCILLVQLIILLKKKKRRCLIGRKNSSPVQWPNRNGSWILGRHGDRKSHPFGVYLSFSRSLNSGFREEKTSRSRFLFTYFLLEWISREEIPVTCERSFSSDFTSTIESEEEKVFDSLIGRILRPCDALMEMVLGFWRQGGRKSTLGYLSICYFRDLFIRSEKRELLSKSRILFTFFLEKLRNLAWMFF